ncbi:MAG: 16S rRNA (cytosine(1402)-N(4))-methyltransferase RsmH, partial [Mucinivorans sp.]
MYHIPVLLKESVELLGIKPDGTYVDVTFGGGGHSREILARLGKKGRLIAFDQDADAMANAPSDGRFTLIRNNFRFVHGCLKALGVEQVDGVLADLGVSSHHFDTPERGFSFRFAGELDMRMNQSSALTAASVVNNYDTQALATIFGRYGEIDKPFRLASAIERYRALSPLQTIDQLLEAVAPCTPAGGESKFRAKLFQAL